MMRGILFLLVLLLSACSTTGAKLSTDNDALAQIEMQIALTDLQQQQLLASKAKLLLAMKLAPDDPEINVAWGYYLAAIGNKTAAESAYQRALSLAPNSAQIQDDYAVFLYQKGDYQKALNYFVRVAAEPTYLYTALAYQNASLAAAKLGKTALAECYRKRAMQELATGQL